MERTPVNLPRDCQNRVFSPASRRSDSGLHTLRESKPGFVLTCMLTGKICFWPYLTEKTCGLSPDFDSTLPLPASNRML